MDASNPIPPSAETPTTPAAPSRAGDGRGPRAISDDEAARLIAGAPPVTDRFAILSRRGGRTMTEDEIAEFLYHTGRPAVADPPPPLPVARVAPAPHEAHGNARPAPTLGYANRDEHDARYSDPRLLAELPLAFRVLRVAPWVLLAVLMLLAMISSVIRGCDLSHASATESHARDIFPS